MQITSPIRVSELKAVLSELNQYKDGQIIDSDLWVENLIDGEDGHLQVREAKAFINGLIEAARGKRLNGKEYRNYIKQRYGLDTPEYTRNFRNFKRGFRQLAKPLNLKQLNALTKTIPDGDITKVVKTRALKDLEYSGDYNKCSTAFRLMFELGYVVVEHGALAEGVRPVKASTSHWGVIPATLYKEYYGDSHSHDLTGRSYITDQPGTSRVFTEMFAYLEALGFSYNRHTKKWDGDRSGKSAEGRRQYLQSPMGVLDKCPDAYILSHLEDKPEGVVTGSGKKELAGEVRAEASRFMEAYTSSTDSYKRRLYLHSDWKTAVAKLSPAAQFCVWFALEPNSREAFEVQSFLDKFTSPSATESGKFTLDSSDTGWKAEMKRMWEPSTQALLFMQLDAESGSVIDDFVNSTEYHEP